MLWPAATRAYTGELDFVAPSIDLAVQFHQRDPDSAWLFNRAETPIARDGLLGGVARVWSANGKLLGTGSGQLLCVPATG